MALKTPIRSGRSKQRDTPTTDKIEQVAGLTRLRRNGRQATTEHERLARDLAELTHDEQVVATHIREGRFQRSLAVIAGMASLLGGLEVSYEHYQGSYSQRVMYSPPFLSLALAGAGIGAAFSRKIARTALPLASVALLVDGVVGFVFHIRGIARKPGGWRIPINNIVMGPPLFAPLLLGISGFLGLVASLLRREDDPEATTATSAPPGRSGWLRWLPRSSGAEVIAIEHEAREGRLQRWLAGATAVTALLNGAEALYSHYKNNFSYRIQWTPVLLSPVVIAAGVGAVFSRTIARTLLPIASALALINGMVGFFYHARGVSRRAGGLKHPIYNVLYGPPIFAPLLYAATGFLGLLASLLRRAN